MVHLGLICPGVPAWAEYRGSGTIELFGIASSVGGGSFSHFDTYRQVEFKPAENMKFGGGFRFGAPFNRYFGLECAGKLLPAPYEDSLHDSRIPPPDPSEEQYDYFDESVAFILDLSLIYRYPLGTAVEPYLAAGIGRIMGSDDVSGSVYSAGLGVILYPVPKMGFRFDLRCSRASVSGFVKQDIPRRAIPFDSKLTFVDLNVGLIFRIFPPDSY